MSLLIGKSALLRLLEKHINSDADRKNLNDILQQKQCDHPTSPATFTESVHKNNIGETAYQRAIFKATSANLGNFGMARWWDMEIPVVFNKSSRRPSLDLIGQLQDDKRMVFCELKYANPATGSKSNGPVYALLELLVYYFHIQNNAGKLKHAKVAHKNSPFPEWHENWDLSEKPENVFLIVAANETYWKRWARSDWKSAASSIVKTCQLDTNVQFFSTPDPTPFLIDQAEKADSKKRYIPAPLSEIWAVCDFL